MTTSSAQNSTADEAPRHETRRLLLGLGILGVSVLGFSSIATGAFFTDSAAVASNAFTTGTVKIGATPTSAALTLPNMAPGDTITAPLTVSNSGTLAQRYAVLSTSDAADKNVLAAQLKLTIKAGVTTCTTAAFAATGTAVYGAGVIGSTTGTKVIGDSATGAQSGDRTLAAGASEVLCAQVTLPGSTDNTFQGKTTTATFTFNAEQSANNP